MYTKNTQKNKYYEREQMNTNCGSFALNIEEWYEPDDSLSEDNWEVADNLAKEGNLSNDEIEKLIFERSVYGIMNDFDGELERIDSPKDYIDSDNTELIAFRTSTYVDDDCANADTDFHFKVFRDGRWQEKYGCGPVIDNVELEENSYWGSGFYVYENPTAYFVHKLT